jgi:hypothetical protein
VWPAHQVLRAGHKLKVGHGAGASRGRIGEHGDQGVGAWVPQRHAASHCSRNQAVSVRLTPPSTCRLHSMAQDTSTAGEFAAQHDLSTIYGRCKSCYRGTDTSSNGTRKSDEGHRPKSAHTSPCNVSAQEADGDVGVREGRRAHLCRQQWRCTSKPQEPYQGACWRHRASKC